jgi:hypothetical protein
MEKAVTSRGRHIPPDTDRERGTQSRTIISEVLMLFGQKLQEVLTHLEKP